MQFRSERTLVPNPHTSGVALRQVKLDLTKDDVTDRRLLLAATELSENYCRRVWRKEPLVLTVCVTQDTVMLPIVFLRRPLLTLESIQNTSVSPVEDVPLPVAWGDDGYLYPATRWPIGILAIQYTGGYEMPTPDDVPPEQQTIGNLPAAVTEAIIIISKSIAEGSRRPTQSAASVGGVLSTTWENPRRALPPQAMQLLMPFRREVL